MEVGGIEVLRVRFVCTLVDLTHMLARNYMLFRTVEEKQGLPV
jgi:hypothetical protein